MLTTPYNSSYYFFNNKYFLDNFVFIKNLSIYLLFFHFIASFNLILFYLPPRFYLFLKILWKKKIKKITHVAKFKLIQPFKTFFIITNSPISKNINIFFKNLTSLTYNYKYSFKLNYKKNNFNLLYKNRINNLLYFFVHNIDVFFLFYYNFKFFFFFKFKSLMDLNFILIRSKFYLIKKITFLNKNIYNGKSLSINFRSTNIFDLLIFNWNLL